MEEKYIQLSENNLLKLGIKDKDGKPTGEYLEFDLEDIELPLKYQELINIIKKNNIDYRNKLVIIDKKQDYKPKGQYISNNDMERIKATQDYYKKQVDAYNVFLGDGGVQKLLNGRKIGWTTLQEVDEIIEKQIAKYFDNTMANITKKVKEKYGNFNVKKEDTLEVVE